MKQTVEEAAREYADKNWPNGRFNCTSEVSFIAGADWQAKQSPWISMKERLPEYNKKVIVLRGDECFISLMYNFGSDCWAIGDDQSNDLFVSENDFWLPIPSFDEILEANKDVLLRMKKVGD
jgi:hypothetical protein